MYIQVIPVLVTHLPVKQDEEEIPTIYNCLLQLLEAGEPNVCYLTVISMYFYVWHVISVKYVI